MADEQFVDAAPAGADGWREVWREDRRYRPQPSRHEWLLRIVRKIFRRAAEPDTERQKNFNLALLDLLSDVRADVAAARRDFRTDLEAVQRDLSAAIGKTGARNRSEADALAREHGWT